MASETEVKTMKGLLAGLTRVEMTWAMLRNFDPDHSTVVAQRRMALGLIGALSFVLERIYHDCSGLRRAENPDSQITIDEVLAAARKASPGLRTEDEDLIREAVTDEVAYSDVSVPELAEKLDEVQPDRGWTEEALLSTLPAERALILRWIEGGADPDETPASVKRVILEDLDLGNDEDLRHLLSWVGIDLPAETDWSSEELRDEVTEWAEAAHRDDRGEADADVPPMPAMFQPDAAVVRAVFEAIAEGVGTGEALRDRFESPAISYALGALEDMGAVLVTEEGLETLWPELSEEWADALAAIAVNLGSRRPSVEGVDLPPVPESPDAEVAAKSAESAREFFGEGEDEESNPTLSELANEPFPDDEDDAEEEGDADEEE